MTQFSAEQLQEKLEVLDGTRARQTRRAAVRIEDVEALLTMPEKLSSEKFAATPPAAVTLTSASISRTTPIDYNLTAVAAGNRTLPSSVTLTSIHAAGATPTGAEFNKVVDDVYALRTVLLTLSAALVDAPTIAHHNAVVTDLTAIRAFDIALKPALPQPVEYNKVVTDLGNINNYLAALAATIPTAAHLNVVRDDILTQLTRLHEVAVALQKRVLP